MDTGDGGGSRPSNLRELEWADDGVVGGGGGGGRVPQPGDAFEIPLEAGIESELAREEIARKQQQRRRASNASGVDRGGAAVPSRSVFRRQSNASHAQQSQAAASQAQSQASARRDVYERAARETTGAARSSRRPSLVSRRSRASGASANSGGSAGRIGSSVCVVQRRGSMASVGEVSVGDLSACTTDEASGGRGGVGVGAPAEAVVIGASRISVGSLASDEELMNEIMNECQSVAFEDYSDALRSSDSDDSDDSESGVESDVFADGGTGEGDDARSRGALSRGALSRGALSLHSKVSVLSGGNRKNDGAGRRDSDVPAFPSAEDSDDSSLTDFDVVLAMRNVLGYHNRHASVTDFADAEDATSNDSFGNLGFSPLRKRGGGIGGRLGSFLEDRARGRCCATAPCSSASAPSCSCLKVLSQHKALVLLCLGCAAALLAIAVVPVDKIFHPKRVHVMSEPRHRAVLPSYLEDNLADREDYLVSQEQLEEELNAWEGASSVTADGLPSSSSSSVVPLFWTMPLCASDFMKNVFGWCYGLLQASDERGVADTLTTFEVDGQSFVNVDVTTPMGLTRASALDLLGAKGSDGGNNGTDAGWADLVVSTPLLHGAVAALFDPSRRGRLLAVFRHPVRRVAAEYRLLRGSSLGGGDSAEANAVARRFDGDVADVQYITLEEYAARTVDNWVTRRLVLGDVVDRTLELTDLELVLAKEILRRKATVGLHDDLPGAVRHFASAVDLHGRGSNVSPSEQERTDFDVDQCVQALVEEHEKADPEGAILPGAEARGEAWNAIAERNRFDIALYEYVEELYEYQTGRQRNLRQVPPR